MRRILAVVKNALREPSRGPDVHFHQGPDGMPAPCYDDGCGTPHLRVD